MEYFLTECRAVFEAQGSLLLSLFIGGLLGSVSHCTGMCGPIVMAQTSARAGRADSAGSTGGPFPSGPLLARMMGTALLPYHFGRMLTYIILGILGASMSQYLVGTPAQKTFAATMLMLAGILFVLKAVPSLAPTGLSAAMAPLVRPYSRFVSALAAPFARRTATSENRQGGNLFFFGVMLGFLPCGLVMAAVMAVASTGDPLTATFGMAAFAVGTMPSLMLVGAGTNFMRRRYPREVDKVANTVMGLNGLILCAVAVRLAL